MQVKTLLAGIVAFAGISQMATAATVTYAASTVGNWSTAANWSGSALPTAADLVVIPSTSTVTFDLTSPATATIGAVDIQGVLNMQAGKTLVLDGNPGYNGVAGDSRIDGMIYLQGNNSTLRFANMNQHLVASSAGRIIGQHANAAIEIADTLTLQSQMTFEGKMFVRPEANGAATLVVQRLSTSVEGRILANVGSGVIVLDQGLTLDDTKFVSGGVSYRPNFESIAAGSKLQFDCAATTLEGNFILNGDCSAEFQFDVDVTTNGDLTPTRGLISVPVGGKVFAPANLGPYTDTPGVYHFGAGC